VSYDLILLCDDTAWEGTFELKGPIGSQDTYSDELWLHGWLAASSSQTTSIRRLSSFIFIPMIFFHTGLHFTYQLWACSSYIRLDGARQAYRSWNEYWVFDGQPVEEHTSRCKWMTRRFRWAYSQWASRTGRKVGTKNSNCHSVLLLEACRHSSDESLGYHWSACARSRSNSIHGRVNRRDTRTHPFMFGCTGLRSFDSRRIQRWRVRTRPSMPKTGADFSLCSIHGCVSGLWEKYFASHACFGWDSIIEAAQANHHCKDFHGWQEVSWYFRKVVCLLAGTHAPELSHWHSNRIPIHTSRGTRCSFRQTRWWESEPTLVVHSAEQLKLNVTIEARTTPRYLFQAPRPRVNEVAEYDHKNTVWNWYL